MKIYVLCDMEGASGISMMEQVQKESPHYALGREFLMGDVNAAIGGLFDGGAAEIVVCDTHGGGGHFLLDKLDSRVVYETPGARSLMPSLDGSFQGLILLGHHAKAGTLNGFLDHTMSSASWFDFALNGVSMGEIGIEAAWAGHFGVPLIMVQGDKAATEEAARFFPGLTIVSVKEGIGRNRARCLSIEKAHDLIRKRAAEAVRSAGNRKPFRPVCPAEVRLVFYRSDYADDWVTRTGVQRIDARTTQWMAKTALELIFPKA